MNWLYEISLNIVLNPHTVQLQSQDVCEGWYEDTYVLMCVCVYVFNKRKKKKTPANIRTRWRDRRRGINSHITMGFAWSYWT